jgi:thioredoxin 1
MEIKEPVNVNDNAFQRVIMESKIPVIVDFWAPWCGPCKMVAPILEKIAGDYAGKLLVAKVNTDENPQWSEKFQVRSIPTMLMVADGKVVHTQVGALPEGMLREVVAEFLNIVETVKRGKS